jgi:16S rRNA (uracil1498-N3)-methyltransferase
MKTTARLYIPGPIPAGGDLLLPADRSHYASRVLRLRANDDVVLFDGSGSEFAASVRKISRDGVTVQVGEARERNVESPLEICLIQGISRGERMDMVVQKATELGVTRIAPVFTEFSIVRLDADKAEKRVQHWLKIAQGACEQCGRNVVPEIEAPRALGSRLETGEGRECTRILLHPRADGKLASLQGQCTRIDLLIGPEGGFSDAEYEQALAAGFAARALGPRLLRTETAAIVALAALQARWGDFG